MKEWTKKQFVSNNIRCPFCGEILEIMSEHIEDDKLILLLHCEDCNDGIDKDWKFTCEIEKIERYFFG